MTAILVVGFVAFWAGAFYGGRMVSYWTCKRFEEFLDEEDRKERGR